MNLKEKFAFLFVTGFSIGLLIMVFVVSFVLSPEELAGEQSLLPMHFICSGLYGAICFSGTICYDIEKWSLLRATVTHFAVVFLSFLFVNGTLKWYPAEILLPVLAMMAAGYAFIWIIMYAVWKAKVENLNRELEKKRFLLKKTDYA